MASLSIPVALVRAVPMAVGMEFRVDEERQEQERDKGKGDAQGNLEFGMEKVSLKVSLRAAVFFVGLGVAAAATAILKLVSQVIEIMGQMRK